MIVNLICKFKHLNEIKRKNKCRYSNKKKNIHKFNVNLSIFMPFINIYCGLNIGRGTNFMNLLLCLVFDKLFV